MRKEKVELLIARLRDALKAKKIQRNRITEMIGVSPSTVGRWLNGTVVPRGLSAHQLERVLDQLEL